MSRRVHEAHADAGTQQSRRLAVDVGASFHTVVSDDVPAALLDFARGVDATQLVVGTSRRSRPARVVSESIGARVVQDCGHIDVHTVTHAEAGRGIRLPRRLSAVIPRNAGSRSNCRS